MKMDTPRKWKEKMKIGNQGRKKGERESKRRTSNKGRKEYLNRTQNNAFLNETFLQEKPSGN